LHLPFALRAAGACACTEMTFEEIAAALLTIVNRLRYRSIEG